MRFLIDPSIRKAVGDLFKEAGHDVRVLAGTPDHALPDEAVLALAVREERILIINDTDFGELIYHQRHSHRGVVLFRLRNQSRINVIHHTRFLLAHHLHQLPNRFVVIEEYSIRIGPPV